MTGITDEGPASTSPIDPMEPSICIRLPWSSVYEGGGNSQGCRAASVHSPVNNTCTTRSLSSRPRLPGPWPFPCLRQGCAPQSYWSSYHIEDVKCALSSLQEEVAIMLVIFASTLPANGDNKNDNDEPMVIKKSTAHHKEQFRTRLKGMGCGGNLTQS